MVANIVVPHPRAGLLSKEVSLRKLQARGKITSPAGCGIKHDLRRELWTAALLGQKTDNSGHVPAGTVAHNRDLAGIQTNLAAMLRHPLGVAISFLISNRDVDVRRERVLHKNHSGIGAYGQITRETLMGREIPHRPSASMEVHHDRHRRLAAARAKNVPLNRAPGADQHSATPNPTTQPPYRDRGLCFCKLRAGLSDGKRLQFGISTLFNVVQKGLGRWI